MIDDVEDAEDGLRAITPLVSDAVGLHATPSGPVEVVRILVRVVADFVDPLV